jgi:hypothetical protein
VNPDLYPPLPSLVPSFSLYTTALVALPGLSEAGQDVSLAHSLDVLGLFCYGAWFCGS